MTEAKKRWLLGELSYHDIRQDPPSAAVLPFGATEPHNLHLPYATDVIEAETVGSRICQQANRDGAKAVCLPAIPYGTETNQQAFPFAMNLNPSTLLAILRDLVESLEKSGVYKCLILNGHGGNEFKGHLRELYGKTKVHLFVCNLYAVCDDVYWDIFEHHDDHAGEMETSFMLHVRPDLVDLERADDGQAKESRFEAVREGWVGLTRPWDRLTTNTGVGNPHQATAEKGKKFLDILVDRLARFLVELSKSELDESFPFKTPPR